MSIDIFSLLQTIPNHNLHYLKRYYNLVTAWNKVNSLKTKEELGYTEKHHILPKSMFPEYKSFSKFPSNKSVLTFPQHIIAHILLWKAFPKEVKMLYAANRMQNQNSNNTPKILTSIELKWREQTRIEFAAAVSFLNKGKIVSKESRIKMSISSTGIKHTDETRRKMSLARRGKKKSDEHQAKISAANTGKIRTEETRAKISAASKGRNKGKKHTKESRAKMSAALIGKKHRIITCPHCGNEGGSCIMKRWHFDNCKKLFTN